MMKMITYLDNSLAVLFLNVFCGLVGKGKLKTVGDLEVCALNCNIILGKEAKVLDVCFQTLHQHLAKW